MQEAIMVSTSLSYGAMELKQSAHRFWVIGLLFSLAIHSAVLGAFHLSWFDGGIDISRIPLHSPHLGPIVWTQPMIPGIVPLRPSQGTTGSVRSERGNPVPVPEEKADPQKNMATQKELAAAVDPQATGTEEGNGTTGIVIPEGGDDTPVPFEAVEQIPVLVTRATPVYPPMAVMAGIEGRVVIKMLVGKDGHVHEAAVESSQAECLNDAALEAARGYLFTPAYMNNGPVSVWITVPFSFKLKQRSE
jgi:TonB family protein